MIEFDVDVGYLLEAGELDCVVLNDENGEHESMTFWPGGGECEVKWHDTEYNGEVDEWTCLSCGERWMQETDWPAACPWCGKAVKP